MQFNLRGILLKWLPICPPIKHLRNASLGLLRLFWCAFKKPVCAEGAHSQLAGTQWLHLSLKVNTHRGGPQIWPFQMPRPPRLSILRDNEQIPIQKRLLCDSVALWCPQHTWVNEWATSLLSKARSELSGAVNVTSVMIHLRWTNGELHYSKTCLTHWHQSNLKTFHWGLKSFCHEVLSGSVVPNLFCLKPPQPSWAEYPFVENHARHVQDVFIKWNCQSLGCFGQICICTATICIGGELDISSISHTVTTISTIYPIHLASYFSCLSIN